MPERGDWAASRPALAWLTLRQTALVRMVLSGWLLMLAACSPELTVQQRLIANIRTMETHIEAGERRPFMNFVTEDFQAQGGQMGREQLNAFVLLQLRQHQALHAQLFPIQVSQDSATTAQARFRALVTGGPGWLPDSGQLFQITTGWRLEDDQWLMNSASWEPVYLEDVLQ